MRYIIMADGKGKRWGKGTPKHLIEIKGETLLSRTVRLLKENNIVDIYITSHDPRYNIEETIRYEPVNNVLEVDRFYSCREIWTDEVCFLYGDVYYTEEAMKTIVETETEDFEFFGRFGQRKEFVKNNGEIFAIKVTNTKKFGNACLFVRVEEEKGNLRGIGWDVYKTLLEIPYKELYLKGHFTQLNDKTEDFDTPEELEKWLNAKKTIAFYIRNIYMGGTEKSMLELIKRIYPKYNIYVCFNGECDIEIALELSKYADIYNINYKNIKCDTCVYVTLYGKKVKIDADKYIQWIHTSMEEVSVEQTPRENIDVFVAVSKEASIQYKNKYNRDSIVIYNEISDNIKELMQDKIKIKKAGLNLVTIARISPEKGFERIYEMAKRLKENNTDFVWYIVGESKNRTYFKMIKEMFKDMPECIFVGNKYNPYPYLKNADYGVMLSTRESYCLFVTECRSLNIPLIVSNWRGVGEQIIEGKNGYIVDMDLNNLDIDKIVKKQLKPINKISSEYKKWEAIL